VAGLAISGRVWLGHDPAAGSGPARATLRECGVLAAVLAVTAVLTVLTPPAAPARAAGPARAVPAARELAGHPRSG
jgi:hypothetical protein